MVEMGELFLSVYQVDGERVLATPETAICLIAINFLGSAPMIAIHLVVEKGNVDLCIGVWVLVGHLGLSFTDRESLPRLASFCQLPVFVLSDSVSCVAGLCAVLRQVVKSSRNVLTEGLLGFREGCLVATAEFSVWTKFCEVDLPRCLESVLREAPQHEEEVPSLKGAESQHLESVPLPEALGRLEVHLASPIRAHQIGRLESVEHKFVEGPSFLLSDILIAIPVHVILSTLGVWDSPHLPLTYTWLATVKREYGLDDSLRLLEVPSRPKSCSDYSFPQIPNCSLYKSDSKRYKPPDRVQINEFDITEGLNKFSTLPMKTYETPVGYNIKLNVNEIPKPDVPSKRLERKIQQLTNLTKAVLQIANKGDLIVDFCSGSGHLGLILAHCLPHCTVILLDNKEKSLDRAREKLKTLKLQNVSIIQSNLDYFTAKFQVGVSLHACGVASDLVIQKCLKSRADFVICPCCYGNIQVNHIVEYPQSEAVRSVGVSGGLLVALGRAADEEGTERGARGMQAVDTDRCLAAEAAGYAVTLAKLAPPTCTPRNNLIVASLRYASFPS